MKKIKLKTKHLLILLLIISSFIKHGTSQKCEGPLTVTMIGASSSVPISIDQETSGVYCTESSEGSINIKVYGGTPQYNYQWAHEDSINQNFLVDLPVGSYHVTVTDANGCSDERSITIVNVDPITDSLDLVDVDACGSCYMHDGTQSFFYFEDEYIGALVDITTDMDLGASMICTEINEDTKYCQGDPALRRKWCFKTDSIENANVRLFFSAQEMRDLAQESGFANEIQMINAGTCYLKVFDFGKDDCEYDFARHLQMNEFTTTMFDEDKGVWSIEITGIDDACVRLLTHGSSLPIDFISFSGVTMADRNRLYWETANEVNNQGFTIEKSKNGLSFDSIGYVIAKNLDEADYSFDDMNPWTGSNFYKLKQEDLDGGFKYSHIIHLVRKADFDFRVIENPFKDILYVQVESNVFIESNISIFSIDGKTVFSSEYNFEEGLTNLNIPIEDIIPGNYLIRFYNKTRNEFLTKKIVKI